MVRDGQYDAQTRRTWLAGAWRDDRELLLGLSPDVERIVNAKDGDLIPVERPVEVLHCYGGPDALGPRGRAGDDVVERGHRRRGLEAFDPLASAKDWWVSHGLEFRCLQPRKSWIGDLFYWLGMKLKSLLLEKRYAYIG